MIGSSPYPITSECPPVGGQGNPAKHCFIMNETVEKIIKLKINFSV